MAFVIFTAIILVFTLILSIWDKSKWYPYLIYIIAVLSLYQTTLLGVGVVGSDIQVELYYAKQALINGWDYEHVALSTSNYSVAIGILTPFLAWVLNIDPIIVFKWIFPAFFAFVPVILYFAFKKQISPKYALYASLFFIIIPVFNMEIASIAKSMIAELFLAIAIWIFLSDIKVIYKICGLILSGVFALATHYTVGIFFLWYIVGITLLIFIGKVFFREWSGPLWAYVTVVIISTLFGIGYFSLVGNGQFLSTLLSIFGFTTNNVASVLTPVGVSSNITSEIILPNVTYLQSQPQFVKSGIGLDFFNVSTLGQIFRIIQYFTQFIILAGIGYAIWNRKLFKPEFIAGALTALSILILCILIPNFSTIANMTRFYHISLFFLAPFFVLGFKIFGRIKQWVFIVIFFVYYLFVSGIVFETVKISNINKFEIPYSHALSANRMGTVGVFTQGDLDCAEWLSKSQDLAITSDWYGLSLLSSYMSHSPRLYFQVGTYAQQDTRLGTFYYQFLTDWNCTHSKYVAVYGQYTGGTGLRDLVSIPDLSNGIEIYSSGNSKVYLMEKND